MLAESESPSIPGISAQESPPLVASSSTAAAAATISSPSQSAHHASGTICKYIRSKQVCPYGSACRYRHPQSHPQPAVCRLFLASKCTYGDKCRYSHPDHTSSSRDSSHQLSSLSSFPSLSIDRVSKHHKKPPLATSHIDQPQLPRRQQQPQLPRRQQQRSRRDVGSDLGAYFERAAAISSRPHVSRPGPHSRDSLRDIECGQLEKRFPEYTLVNKDKEEVTYSVTYTPTDPQWQLDALMLTANFPSEYPRQIMQLRVTGGQPSQCCLERVNSALSDKIDEMFSNSKLSGQYELMFRPILHWLDSHVTGIVAACYCHHQQHSEEEEEESNEHSSSSHDEEALASSDEDKESRSWTKPLKKGTELRLQGIKLSQSVATLQCTRAKLSIQCTRCRHVMDITCGHKQLSADCDHCHQCYCVTYHTDLIHATNNSMGFVDVLGCQVFDVVLSSCECVVVCIECNKESPVHGLSYGQPITSWCGNCHSKLSVAIEEVKFFSHQLSDTIATGISAASVAKKKKKKEPLFQEGTPLPSTGTCDHYKKSHRWLRFPCCGKVYPCDVCHDSTEDHIMERAKRMICGYCSKEQPYTGDKPCILCGSNMTGSNKSSYWEGGQGCRNKVVMSRNDNHKYTGSSKISSKKTERVGSKGKANRETAAAH